MVKEEKSKMAKNAAYWRKVINRHKNVAKLSMSKRVGNVMMTCCIGMIIIGFGFIMSKAGTDAPLPPIQQVVMLIVSYFLPPTCVIGYIISVRDRFPWICSIVLNLCAMLLEEFKDTHNMDILEEVASHLKPLQKAAKKQYSHEILAETYVLEANLNMLQNDWKAARHSLTQAQQIAEKNGLNLLALKISNDHDKLLHSREIWDQMKRDNVDLSDQLEEVGIQDQLATMLKKKPAVIPETSPESPILLLVMADSGIPLYTKIFNKEWQLKEELFSGFLSAFNSFSNEIFSKGLDRANFGKFTILMTGMPPFMSCYVFKGQSFLAHQKFAKFNTTLHDSKQIWQILTSANHTGQIVRDDANEGLGKLVKTLFY